MKYIPFLFILVGCSAPRPSADTPLKHTYEVTCPITMTTVVVDTVQGNYYYYHDALEIYRGYGKKGYIGAKQYPSTCVVKTLY